MLTVVPVILAHGDARIWRNILHGRWIGGCGRDHRGIFHSAEAFESGNHLSHGGPFLADRHVDTLNIGIFLVNYGVNSNRGLTGLAVSDDKFTLPTADRNHRVDGLDAGLQRLLHRLPLDDAWRHDFNHAKFSGFNRAFSVNGLAD